VYQRPSHFRGLAFPGQMADIAWSRINIQLHPRDETLRVSMDGRVQIDRFAVNNFRSIQECDVELSPLTFFIGANASGKTSFVDAILFVASALRSSLEKSISDRGGIYSILHHPIKLPVNTRFDFCLSSPTGFRCEFHLELRIIDGWSFPLLVKSAGLKAQTACNITMSWQMAV
jgi:hypothetical protein